MSTQEENDDGTIRDPNDYWIMYLQSHKILHFLACARCRFITLEDSYFLCPNGHITCTACEETCHRCAYFHNQDVQSMCGGQLIQTAALKCYKNLTFSLIEEFADKEERQEGLSSPSSDKEVQVGLGTLTEDTDKQKVELKTVEEKDRRCSVCTHC